MWRGGRLLRINWAQELRLSLVLVRESILMSDSIVRRTAES
jgi:hypothetical protein